MLQGTAWGCDPTGPAERLITQVGDQQIDVGPHISLASTVDNPIRAVRSTPTPIDALPEAAQLRQGQGAIAADDVLFNGPHRIHDEFDH